MKSVIQTSREDVLKVAKPIKMDTIAIRTLLDKYSSKKTERILVPEFALEGGLSRIWDNGKNINPANLKMGDVLYVQEEWAYDSRYEDKPDAENHIIYKISEFENPLIEWKSSDTMEPEQARLFLFIYRIENERLQEINTQGRHDDILNEGYPFGQDVALIPTEAFKTYWDGKLNKSEFKTGCWDANPYVWVLSFIKLELVNYLEKKGN